MRQLPQKLVMPGERLPSIGELRDSGEGEQVEMIAISNNINHKAG